MICPNCQVDVSVTEQLFGSLYTCTQCRAMYFINFEGQPEFGDITLTPSSDSFESSLEPLIDSIDVISFDNKLEEQFVALEPQGDLQLPEAALGYQDNNQILNQSLNLDLNQNLKQENSKTDHFAQDVFQQTKQNTGSKDLFTEIAKEISDFGNTEVQLANLNYDLKIKGLDTHELLQLFKEAIEDSKFAWDVSEIMRSIKNGQVNLEKLNPVKAFILAKRLQFLDVEKDWKQNAMA